MVRGLERFRDAFAAHTHQGDIDPQGLRILAGLRQTFPNMESILMDEETFDRFPDFWSSAPADEPRAPDGLTPAEERLYVRLVHLEHGNRLEQERVPGRWASERIQSILVRGPIFATVEREEGPADPKAGG